MMLPDNNVKFERPISSFSQARIELCTNNRIDPPHWHDFAHIWYTLQGTAKYTVNDVEYELPHGTLLLIPPFSRHFINTLNNIPKKLFCFSFSIKLYNDIVSSADNLPPLVAFGTFGPYIYGESKAMCVQLPPDSIKLFDNFFLELNDSYCEENYPIEYFIHQLKYALDLFPTVSAKSIKSSKLISAYNNLCLITNVAHYINSNFHSQISVEDVSRIAAMSKNTFFEKFRKITGVTFISYVNARRLLSAENMLIATDFSLDKIAEMTGFAHKSHFIRTFKKSLHCSPSEYRQSSREYYREYRPNDLPKGLKIKSK